MSVYNTDDIPITKISENVSRRVGHNGDMTIAIVDIVNGPFDKPDPFHAHVFLLLEIGTFSDYICCRRRNSHVFRRKSSSENESWRFLHNSWKSKTLRANSLSKSQIGG